MVVFHSEVHSLVENQHAWCGEGVVDGPHGASLKAEEDLRVRVLSCVRVRASLSSSAGMRLKEGASCARFIGAIGVATGRQ